MILMFLKSAGQLFCKVAAIWVLRCFPTFRFKLCVFDRDPRKWWCVLLWAVVGICPAIGAGIFDDLVKVILAGLIIKKLLFFSL